MKQHQGYCLLSAMESLQKRQGRSLNDGLDILVANAAFKTEVLASFNGSVCEGLSTNLHNMSADQHPKKYPFVTFAQNTLAWHKNTSGKRPTLRSHVVS